jgi:hypothetical protein
VSGAIHFSACIQDQLRRWLLVHFTGFKLRHCDGCRAEIRQRISTSPAFPLRFLEAQVALSYFAIHPGPWTFPICSTSTLNNAKTFQNRTTGIISCEKNVCEKLIDAKIGEIFSILSGVLKIIFACKGASRIAKSTDWNTQE